MNKVQLRKLLAANQFIIEESRNKVAANKSWFTVLKIYILYCIEIFKQHTALVQYSKHYKYDLIYPVSHSPNFLQKY
jgi:hypothetical protein